MGLDVGSYWGCGHHEHFNTIYFASITHKLMPSRRHAHSCFRCPMCWKQPKKPMENHQPWTSNQNPSSCIHLGRNPGLSSDNGMFYHWSIQAHKQVIESYIVTGNVSPPGSYFKLKLAILLSLVSQLDRQVGRDRDSVMHSVA